jgi:hypothetical protein
VKEWGCFGASNGIWSEVWVAPLEVFAELSGMSSSDRMHPTDVLNAACGLLLGGLGGFLGDELRPRAGRREGLLLEMPQSGPAHVSMLLIQVDRAKEWPGRREWLEKWANSRGAKMPPLLSFPEKEVLSSAAVAGVKAWSAHVEKAALNEAARSVGVRGGAKRM